MPRSAPRQLLDRPDDWPDGTTSDPHADRAQQLARNLTKAMGSMTVRDLAESSGVSIGTISNVTRGLTWLDALAVMRLEQALGKAVWLAWPKKRLS